MTVGVAAVIGAVASVVGTVGSLVMQGKAMKAQEKQQELTTRRSRRQAIRQMQLTRAQSLMSAQGAGSLYGSGAAGGIGALSSQLGADLGYQTAYNSLSGDISRANQAANLFSGIASVGGTLFNMSGGFGGSGGAQPAGPVGPTMTAAQVRAATPNRPPSLAPTGVYNPRTNMVGALGTQGGYAL